MIMFMTEPTLRAVMESGQTWDDPSEDLLFLLLSDLEAGQEQFLIVERTADTTGQTYAQVRRTDDGRYQAERRDGGPGQHFQAVTPDKRLVHSLLTAWAFELPGWRESQVWKRIDLSG
jgi:hypothetical protein